MKKGRSTSGTLPYKNLQRMCLLKFLFQICNPGSNPRLIFGCLVFIVEGQSEELFATHTAGTFKSIPFSAGKTNNFGTQSLEYLSHEPDAILEIFWISFLVSESVDRILIPFKVHVFEC